MSSITIRNVDINEDNGIVYTCRAANVVGYAQEFTSINVFGK